MTIKLNLGSCGSAFITEDEQIKAYQMYCFFEFQICVNLCAFTQIIFTFPSILGHFIISQNNLVITGTDL